MNDELSRLAEFAQRYQSMQQRNPSYQIGAESLGWGILGASAVAANFTIPAIRSQPPAPPPSSHAGSWVAGLFSHNERRARQFADEHQIPQIYLNLEDLLTRHEIRCIYVSSHPRHHFPLAMAALSAGKHVFCEPPLALTIEEANTLALTASDRGLLLSINYTQRGHAPMQMLRSLIASETIGDILGGRILNTVLLPPHKQTWRLQGNGGGVIFDRTIHDIDLLRYILNDEIEQVYASSSSTMPTLATSQVEEDILVHLHFKRQPLIFQLYNSFLIGHTTSGIEVFGTQGALWTDHWSSANKTSALMLRRHNQVKQMPIPYIDPFWQAIYRFNLAIRENQPPLTTALDGVSGIEISLAIQRSRREKVPAPLRATGNRPLRAY